MKNKTTIKLSAIALFFVAGTFSFSSCAPVFSELQTAKTLDAGTVQVSPTLTRTGFSHEGENQHLQNQAGVLVDIGATDEVDIRLKYEHVFSESWEMGDIHVVGAGLKFPLLRDKIAVSLPVGLGIADGETTDLQFQPSLLFTQNFSDAVSWTIAPKGYFVFNGEPYEPIFGLNTNVEFSMTERIHVMPELGILFHTQEEGIYNQLSLAFRYKFGNSGGGRARERILF